jgi:hypothetical protein
MFVGGKDRSDRSDLSSSVRLVVAGLASLAALTFSGTAFGKSYEPSLVVTPAKYTLGAKTGVGVALDEGECCFAPGRITIYSPPGYGVKLEHPAGTRMGSLIGRIRVGDAEHMAIGSIVAESPENHVGNSCAPGTHNGVWMIEFAGGPYRFRIPMYVDRVTTAAEAVYASARMVICFASPYVPPPRGAQAGIAHGGMAFGVADVFTNPTSAGTHAWNAVSVPYAHGSAALSPQLAAQSTSYVRLPVAFDLTVKRVRRGSKIFVTTVCLRENGEPIRGVRIQIVGRPKPRDAFTRYGLGRTDARGCITRRFQPKHKVILGHVWVESPLRRAGECSGALAPQCSRPTIAPVHLERTFRLRR